MSTLYITHPLFLSHNTGRTHPEHRVRLEEINRVLRQDAFRALVHDRPTQADDSIITLVHDRDFLQSLEDKMPAQGSVFLEADTVVSPDSLAAARYGVGAVCLAIDHVMQARAVNAFCGIRPPGHHAGPRGVMGFCLFSQVAIGAFYALQKYDLERVAILDFDVHHGNGSQDAVAADERILFVSTHQYPFYPGSGGRDDIGVGNCINYPLLAGSDGKQLVAAWVSLAERLRGFQPQLLLLSSGFDAHKDDPLAQLEVESADFATLTAFFTSIAKDCCHGRLVSCLEGGYNVKALGESVGYHVATLMEAEK